MPTSETSAKTSRLIVLATVCVIVTVLHLAQEVLIPIALAILFSFLLAPLVHRLERMKFPRALAVVVSVLLGFGVLTGIGFVVYYQLGDLFQHKAEYTATLQAKASSFQHGRFVDIVHNANAEVSALKKGSMGGSTTQPVTPQAMPVEVVNPATPSESSSPMEWITTIGGKLLGPLGTAFIVTVFTIFMLLQREDLRDRIIRLAGRDRMTLTTKALDDAANRVSRYLMLQTIVNGSVGVIVTILLWSVGKILGHPFPSPALWGLLAALLRFVPYIGIWISSIGPVLLSMAVFPAARGTILTIGVYGLTEIITANAIEPMLFGSSTGIATLAVLVAAAFWTWLWGPVGLLLSTPLTVCLVVMGKYVPQLEFLNILLADEPALSASDRVYQRLLADDTAEATELVEEYQKKMHPEQLLQDVLLPALATTEADHYRNATDEDRHDKILNGFRKIVAEVSDRLLAERKKLAAQNTAHRAKGEPETVTGPQQIAPRILAGGIPADCDFGIICVPAHADADDIAGHMIGLLLQLRGYCVSYASVDQLASELVRAAETAKADLVVVSALPPAAVTHGRYLCKRLHEHRPDLPVVVGLWTAEGDLSRATERIAGPEAVRSAATFSDALQHVHELAQPRLMAAAERP